MNYIAQPTTFSWAGHCTCLVVLKSLAYKSDHAETQPHDKKYWPKHSLSLFSDSTQFWDFLSGNDVGGWTILKWTLEREDGMVWTGLIWLRIKTSRGLLWKWYWTFRFYKMLGSSWVAAQLEAPQEQLSSVCK
jgi:hypothetical protein